MFKKTIAYTDFDGADRTEECYFNLTKSELMEMDFSAAGGMDTLIKKIIDEKDTKRLIELFKEIILKSYGEKSFDGKSFIKIRDGHRLSDDFAQTAAYDALFMELATDDKAATDFITSIIPKKMADELAASGEIAVLEKK